jgi:hypothetical protein
MPLSEHEQRLLEQIERALYQDDPKLASTVRAINPRAYVVRRLWRSGALFLLGLATLIVAVVINSSPATVVLGLVGFAIMLLAALRSAADLKRLGGRPDVGPRRANGSRRGNRSTTRRPFMERLEDRWRRRWEDRGER